jgi:hypothetical protein
MADYQPPSVNPHMDAEDNLRQVLAYWLGLLAYDPRWQAHADQAYFARDAVDVRPDEMTAEQLEQWRREIIDFLFVLYCASK